MAKAERVELIKQLQAARGNTFLIPYITSTRQNLEITMAMDAVRIIYEHLRAINKPKEEVNIDLFIHSNGGDGTVPWRLVTLIREYTNKLSVLVPHRAFSAATLTALGADSVVMHPMGMLGPTDPTVANDFNPPNPSNPDQPLGISVEDVTAYIALIKEDAGIHHEDELVQAFNKLADHVHPLALGNVKRSLSQSRMMARKLLALHMDNSSDTHKIDEIVDSLTSKLFYHGHPINRYEARDQVGLATVEIPPLDVEDLMWRLYLEYEAEIKMEQPFQAAMEYTAKHPGTVGGKATPRTATETAKLAFVESTERTDALSIDYQLGGQPHPSTPGATLVNLFIQRQGWQTE
jgi:hypothetical protein